jgi:hypothetical protein
MKYKALTRYLAIVSVLALIGCNKPATSDDSTASSDGNSASKEGTSRQRNSESDPGYIPAPRPIVIEAGTPIVVTADQSISSKTSRDGDSFDASVAEPVMVGDKVAIPRGAKAIGTVTESKSAGRFKGSASLAVTLSSVTVNGKEYTVRTSEVMESGKGRGKRTAIGTGGGAAVGALIGALAGGGKGAAIGAGAGGGAGLAGSALTGNRDYTIEAESKLTFELREHLEIKRR